MKKAGFTGVLWEARPAEKLAHDLHNGPGEKSISEAGFAWARVSKILYASGVDYAKILSDLGGAWESGSSEASLKKYARLKKWFLEATVEASENVSKAQSQAAITSVAILSMPNVSDLSAARAVLDSLEKSMEVTGASVSGIAAQQEQLRADQSHQAAAVMRSYETSSEPLHTVWKLTPPPSLADGKALQAEKDAAQVQAAEANAGVSSGGGIGYAIPNVVPAPLGNAAPKSELIPRVAENGRGVIESAKINSLNSLPAAPLNTLGAHDKHERLRGLPTTGALPTTEDENDSHRWREFAVEQEESASEQIVAPVSDIYSSERLRLFDLDVAVAAPPVLGEM